MCFDFADVIGNLTRLSSLDLSFNQIEDLVTEKDVFILPPNVTELNLAFNKLHDLPWKNMKNATNITKLDLSNNNFDSIGSYLTRLVTNGSDVIFEGTLSILNYCVNMLNVVTSLDCFAISRSLHKQK